MNVSQDNQSKAASRHSRQTPHAHGDNSSGDDEAVLILKTNAPFIYTSFLTRKYRIILLVVATVLLVGKTAITPQPRVEPFKQPVPAPPPLSRPTYNFDFPATRPPSLTKPFIFFHQRKAGGTTIRQMLFSASQVINSTSFIPCHTPGLDCQTYYTPSSVDFPSPIPTVYGGHLCAYPPTL